MRLTRRDGEMIGVIGLGLAYAAGVLTTVIVLGLFGFGNGAHRADEVLEAKELEALRARRGAIKH